MREISRKDLASLVYRVVTNWHGPPQPAKTDSTKGTLGPRLAKTISTVYNHGPAPATELAKLAGMTITNFHKAADVLIEQGYIEFETLPGPSRPKLLWCSQKGTDWGDSNCGTESTAAV